MDEINPNKHTAAQLRCWLQRLNLPTTGTKNTLVLRLSEVPENQRGVCPVDVSNATASNADTGECGECPDEVSSMEEYEAGVHTSKNISNNNAYDDYRSVCELLKRELDVTKREKELLKRENELYKRMRDFEKFTQSVVIHDDVGEANDSSSGGKDGHGGNKRNDASGDGLSHDNDKEDEGAEDDNNGVKDNGGDTNDSNGGKANDSNGKAKDGTNERNNDSNAGAGKGVISGRNDREVAEVQYSGVSNSFALLRELLPEYDGSIAPVIFVAQLRNARALYSVDESTMKALLMSKAKGKIQVWLRSKSSFVNDDLDALLDEMVSLFGEKESKLSIRRKFEIRKWHYNEDFLSYFNDKVLLADRLSIPEDELIDYIIDGIPDTNLRVHANLQCFHTKAQLLMGFSKVQLKRPLAGRTEGREVGVRCYNCNCLGHYAKECQKPRREMGACYSCGAMDHLVAVCPERKFSGSKVDNIYLRYFKCSFNINFENHFYIECLMDTGSPASFIRRSMASRDLSNMKKDRSSFFSFNNIEFKTVGKLLFFVLFENKMIEIEIFVVEDALMAFDCVLGRDFLNVAGLTLMGVGEDKVKNSRGSTEEEIFEAAIMSIEYGDVCTVDLRTDEGVRQDTQRRLERLFLDTYLRPKRPLEPETLCEIKLNLEKPRPFSCRPRRLSYDEKGKLQIILDDYLSKGYIRSSESEYASPIVLVKKKTGELRMCVDYRTLNKMTLRDNYPIPLIDDLLDRLAGKQYFTKLDLKNGFYHVFVADESVKYTSFVTPLGQYEFLRMPFGLKNAPSVFQRFVNKIFADMVKNEKLIVYMDDLMIATKDVEEHLGILRDVFERLVRNKLELRLDKCEFLRTNIKYLGYEISGGGIRADDTGLRAVENFPVPTSVHSVRSFLGLTSYFRRFVKDFSIIAKPLSDLTRKDRSFVFGPVELEAFETLKRKLLQSPILALYDPKDDTELHCDASSTGFGAILLQKKEDGKMHPVFYYSRRTSDSESKYHSFELETLAILYALRRFRPYLQGKTFKIVTDCNSLTMTLNRRDMNPRIARWSLEFQDYDYVLEHRSGSRMQHVDALSRSLLVMAVESNSFEENLVICQNRDPVLARIRESLQKNQSKMFEMRNGVLYKKTNKDDLVLFCVPEAMESHVFYKYHDEMGHVGTDKMVDLISGSYWFPQIRKKALEHVKNCLRCIAYSDKPGKEEGFLNNIPKSPAPFDVIHIDHYGPVDNGRSLKYILVIIDASTKFVRLYATKTTKTKESVEHLKNYFRAYSRPRCIVSDRGTAFTSSEFQDFLKEYGIKHVKIATGSPQANGQVERVNRSLGPMLAKLVRPEEGVYWDKVLDRVEYTLNNTVHRTIGQHPSVMLFGLGQRGPVIDSLRECLLSDVGHSGKVDHSKIRQEASKKQEILQSYNKRNFDKRRKAGTKYKVGDYVMVRNFDSHVGVSRKLIPKFKGPYMVAKVLRNDRYLLEDVEGFQQSRNPYKGVWAVGNIRPWFRGQLGVASARGRVTSFVRMAEL